MTLLLVVLLAPLVAAIVLAGGRPARSSAASA